MKFAKNAGLSTLLIWGVMVAHANANLCQTGLSGVGAELLITSPNKSLKVEKIQFEDFFSLTAQDLASKSNKVIQLRDSALAQAPMQILTLSEYPKTEQQLIRSLIVKSKQTKFRERNKKRNGAGFDKLESEELLEIFKQLADAKKISRKTLHEMEDLLENNTDVEFGAWRLTLRDGKVLTALHTASESQSTGTATLKAVEGILAKNGVTMADIAIAQYFHNHVSGRFPLSAGDELLPEVFVKHVKKTYHTDVVCHVYAVGEIDHQIITYHIGIEGSAPLIWGLAL